MFPMFLALSGAAFSETLPSGTMEVRVDGQVVHLPMVKTEVDADIHGDLATVRMVQTFANPSESPLSATYAFPLPSDAAVSGMELVAGDIRVVAEVQRKEEAQATFDQAKANGQQAALLTQHRPNVFTQDVANLPPGESIRVSITYVHAVPKVDGAFEWVLPVAVGPRYVPGQRLHSGEPEPLAIGTWTVPQAGAELELEPWLDPGRLALTLEVHPGAPVTALHVDHDEARTRLDGDRHRVELSGRVANRDVVVRYQLADDEVAASTTTSTEGGRGVLSLLVDPPASVEAARLTPREVVYVFDTSGSMSGPPLDTVKRFAHRSLDTLRPGDFFRLVRFDNTASEFARGAIPYNAENAAVAHAWLDALHAGGGTEMRTGVNAALDPAAVPGTVRVVVFLTDGYIGNDADVIRLIESKDGGARLFALGVGGSVNRWLLEEMARVGRGVARVVTDPTTADAEADRLAHRLAAPYLTDVTIDWGDAPVRDVTPAVLPDLFLGEPLRVLAKVDRAGTWDVLIRGTVAGNTATLPVRVEVPEASPDAQALPLVWARSQIEDRMHRYLSPTTGSDERSSLQSEVTTLGLEYGLATQWTSFVAVVPESPQLAMALPTPAPTFSGGTSFGGSAAPEPAGWAATLLMLALGGRALRTRRPTHAA